MSKKNKNIKLGQKWLIRVVSAPGYVSLLVAWTSLIGYLAISIAPFLLQEQGSIHVENVKLANQTSSYGGNSILVYVLVLIIVVALWSLLVSQIAKVFTWLQARFRMNKIQLLSLKVGLTVIGWLTFAPVFSIFVSPALLQFSYIWLASGLLLTVGSLSFIGEYLIANKFNLKQKSIW